MRTRWMGGAAAATAATALGLAIGVAPTDASPAVASARLVDINGNQVGSAMFHATGDGGVTARVELAIDNAVTGNPSEFHGMHLHANSNPANGNGCVTYAPGTEPAPAQWFVQVDGHWDVGGHSHGAHTGDLPSVIRESDGTAVIEFEVDKHLVGELPGRALIVHFGADDFGKHPTQGTSATTGNAGPRYACGLVVPTASGR